MIASIYQKDTKASVQEDNSEKPWLIFTPITLDWEGLAVLHVGCWLV